MAGVFKWTFRLLIILGCLIIVIVAALISLAVLRPDLAKPGLQELAHDFGVKLKIEDLEFETEPFRLELKGVELAVQGSKQSIKIDELRLEPVLEWPGDDSPLFKLVRIKGLTARASPGRDTSSQAPDPAPLGWIFLTQELEVLDWRVDWSQPGFNLKLSSPSLTLKPSGQTGLALNALADFGAQLPAAGLSGSVLIKGIMEPGPALSGLLELKQASVKGPRIRGPLDLMMKFRLTPQGFELPSLSAGLSELKLHLDPQAPALTTALNLKASARGDLKGEALNIDINQLELPGFAQATGKLSFGSSSGWRVKLQGNIFDINKLKQDVSFLIPKALEDLTIKGALPFDVGVSQAGESFRITAAIRLQDAQMAWPAKGVKANISGPLKVILGSNGAPSLQGDLAVRGSIEQNQLSARDFELNLPLVLDPARLQPQRFKLVLPPNALKIMDKDLAVGAIDINGRVSWHPDSRLSLELLEMKTAKLGSFSGGWELDGDNLNGWFEGKGLEAAKAASLAQPWLGNSIADWQPAGTLDLQLKFYDLMRKPAMRIRISSKGLGCESPDGAVMARNLNPHFEVLFNPGPSPRITAELSLKSGEALWDTVFVSFDKMPLKAELKGRMAGGGGFKELAAQLQLAAWANIQLKGEMNRSKSGWNGQGELEFNSPDISPLFSTFVKEPFAETNPALTDLEVKGKTSFKGSFKGPLDKLFIEGRLNLQNASLIEKQASPLVRGLDLKLPLAYQLGSVKTKAVAKNQVKEWGMLKLGGLNLGGFKLGGLQMPLALTPNRLYLNGALHIPLLGGGLHISDIQLDNPLSSSFKGSLAADLEEIDLSQLKQGGLLLEGKLKGGLAPVSLTMQGVKAKGGISGSFMGGKLNLTNLGVRQPLSPNRTLLADLTFDGLDMEALSRALDLGQVTGRISGYVKELVLAYGQPQSFKMWLKSDPGSAFEQMVSLKAVNTIAVLGTGSGLPSLGLGLFASIFNQFPYETIGFSCILKNDLFMVKGLIVADGVEYLVKRPFWGGINVINRNRENRITFSDMMERLKRINRPKTGDKEKQNEAEEN